MTTFLRLLELFFWLSPLHSHNALGPHVIFYFIITTAYNVTAIDDFMLIQTTNFSTGNNLCLVWDLYPFDLGILKLFSAFEISSIFIVLWNSPLSFDRIIEGSLIFSKDAL